jgi:hypothetical protein
MGAKCNSTVENIDRIIADDYVPTSRDALHAWACPRVIDETVLERNPGSPTLTVCSIGSHMLRSRKWIQQIEPGASMIVFPVDLAGYNRPQSTEDPDTSEMEKAMVLFDSIVNSRMCSSAYPVVWFSNSSLLDGGPNFRGAVRYFTPKFRDLYRGRKDFFTRSSGPEDRSLMLEIFGLAMDVVIQEALRTRQT